MNHLPSTLPTPSASQTLSPLLPPFQIGVGDGGGVFVPDVSHLEDLHALVADSPAGPLDGEDTAAYARRVAEENVRLKRVLQCGMQLLLQATMPTMGEEVRLDEFAGICMRTMNRESRLS